MKQVFTYLSMASVIFLASCGNSEEAPKEEVAVEPVVATYNVDTAASSVQWTGSKKFTEGSHTGTVDLSSGEITTTDGEVTSATFVVDLKTLQATDDTPEEKKGYLIGHLMSPDFLAVDSLGSTASFEVASYEDGMMKGAMTVMGVTKDVEIPATVTMNEGSVSVSGDFNVNLAQFGMALLNNMQDAAEEELDAEQKQSVYNPEVAFKVDVKATKK